MNYGDTFSLVAKMALIRLFISLAATCKVGLSVSWIFKLYFHGDFPKEIYTEKPLGVIAQEKFGGCVCRLRKVLYGLK